MFFRLSVDEITRGELGWILSKHPDSTFSKDFTWGTLRGHWEEGTPHSPAYAVSTDCDSLGFLKAMRKLNKASYVSSLVSAVCPLSLSALRKAFSSALSENFKDESTRHLDTFICSAVVGPWVTKQSTIEFFMESMGIETTAIQETKVGIYKLSVRSPITVSEFLQRVFVASVLLTKNLHVGRKNEWDSKMEAIAALSSKWTDRYSCFSKLPPWAAEAALGLHPIGKDESTGGNKQKSPISHDALPLSLHQRRHQWIIDTVVKNSSEMKNVVDYGCAQGTLSKALRGHLPEECTIHAVDAIKSKYKLSNVNGVRKIQDNLLYPSSLLEKLLSSNASEIDLLVLTEVIEHFRKAERAELIRLIAQDLRPKYLIVTTPNRNYNRFIENLQGNGWRHKDHFIEYDRSEWEEEVMRPLRDTYGYRSFEELHLLPAEFLPDGANPDQDQPSFVSLFQLEARGTNYHNAREGWQHFLGRLKDGILKDFRLQHAKNFLVKSRAISTGLVAPDFIETDPHGFFRGPTIAPVQYTKEAKDYLEHPAAAFSYFREKGISRLWAEYKYMGSRAHVLVFSGREALQRSGSTQSDEVRIVTRTGRAFFPAGDIDAVPEEWKQFLQDGLRRMKLDFAFLDAEIMPWAIKGGALIHSQFEVPGLCAVASREYMFGPEDPATERAKKFLDVLDVLGCYSRPICADNPLTMRVFGVLAAGLSVDGSFQPTIQYDTATNAERYEFIDALCADGSDVGILPVERFPVDLNDPKSQEDAVSRWEKYCSMGEDGSIAGEGYVFKTDPTLREVAEDGVGLVQPMLKVRGRDYLRIIYGMDYLEPERFHFIKNRNVRAKRKAAILQNELSRNILLSFLDNDFCQLRRAHAAFCGESDSIVVDATL